MPGTPHHALGGPLPTIAVATSIAVLCTTVLLAGRRAETGYKTLAVGGGVGYAAVLLLCWTLVRLLFWRFTGEVSTLRSAVVLAGILAAIVAVLTVQWAAATVSFVRYGIRVTVGWLFVTAWVTTYAYLLVGGESGGVFLLLVWALTIGPGLLCVLGVLAGSELLLRRTLTALR